MQAFFQAHPDVPRTYTIMMGGAAPRLVLGGEQGEGPRGRGGYRFLSNVFTARSPQWYVSMRAIGLSMGDTSAYSLWTHDFNSVLPSGLPALLDSAATGIHLSTGLYMHIVSSLPYDCEQQDDGTTVCECTEGKIAADFPSISISFESASTIRFLGLDSGDEVRVCIPPTNYVRYNQSAKKCRVDFIDTGRHRSLYGFETVVLGAPFFRSTAVFLDVERRRAGLGALDTAASRTGGSGGGSPDGEWHHSDGMALLSGGSDMFCSCADPKSWWNSGHRFSPKRVVVCLIGVSLLAAYIWIGYSTHQTAQWIRVCCDAQCPGVAEWFDDSRPPLRRGPPWPGLAGGHPPSFYEALPFPPERRRGRRRSDRPSARGGGGSAASGAGAAAAAGSAAAGAGVAESAVAEGSSLPPASAAGGIGSTSRTAIHAGRGHTLESDEDNPGV